MSIFKEISVDEYRYEPTCYAVDHPPKEAEVLTHGGFGGLFSSGDNVVQPPLHGNSDEGGVQPLDHHQCTPDAHPSEALKTQHFVCLRDENGFGEMEPALRPAAATL